MKRLFLAIVCVLLLSSCGVYEEGDIIKNEPLVINASVDVVGELTEEDCVELNTTNSSYYECIPEDDGDN